MTTNGNITEAIVRVDPKEYGVDENHAKQVEATFRPMLDKMTELEDRFNEVAALGVGPETCEQARKLRLEYVKVRTGTATIHKDLKAFFLAAGRFIDGWKNAQLFASQGKEEALKAIEEHYERIEQARITKLAEDRAALLEPYGIDPMHLNLGMMADDVWGAFLDGTRMRHEQRIEAERKAEADRLAAIEADKERQRKQAEENNRLRAEAEKREAEIAEERAKLERARRAAEAKVKKERFEAERARREAEAEAHAKLKAERDARDRLERELREKREAEARAEADRIAAEQAELAKGDEEKYSDMIGDLQEIAQKYSFKSVRYSEAFSDAVDSINQIVSELYTVRDEMIMAGEIAE